jgi:hypothetical protein
MPDVPDVPHTMATLAILQYPQGDRLVVLRGSLIYAEDPQDRGCCNTVYNADFIAQEVARVLGLSEPQLVAVPAEIACSESDQYEKAVEWYNRQKAERDAGLEAVVDKLLGLAEANEEVQFAIDDLVYEHVGTGKHASDINNRGISGQVDTLLEHLGLEDTLTQLNGVVADFTDDAGVRGQVEKRRQA